MDIEQTNSDSSEIEYVVKSEPCDPLVDPLGLDLDFDHLNSMSVVDNQGYGFIEDVDIDYDFKPFLSEQDIVSESDQVASLAVPRISASAEISECPVPESVLKNNQSKITSDFILKGQEDDITEPENCDPLVDPLALDLDLPIACMATMKEESNYGYGFIEDGEIDYDLINPEFIPIPSETGATSPCHVLPGGADSKFVLPVPAGQQKFECEICHKVFKRKHHLRKHLSNHSDKREHVCFECGMQFKRKEHLKIHMMRHNVERQKSSECPWCDMKYYRNDHLKRHIKIRHPGKLLQTNSKTKAGRGTQETRDKRSYLCSVCGSQFNRNSTLKTHMLIHTREQASRCPYCEDSDKEFTSVELLRRHIQRYHHNHA